MAFRLTFGGKHMPATYYDELQRLIAELQPASTLRSLSDVLNGKNLTTPTGLKWNKSRLANFIRLANKKINSTKEINNAQQN